MKKLTTLLLVLCLLPGALKSQVTPEVDLAELDPIAWTEAIAYDFLVKGGKYSRPFITLTVYDALTGARGTASDGPRHLLRARRKHPTVSLLQSRWPQ